VGKQFREDSNHSREKNHQLNPSHQMPGLNT
jgi:hypothetical protein